MKKLTVNELKKLIKDNKYVKGITKDSGIMYTDEFYKLLNQKLQEGIPSLDAYASFGFDIDILGENRAFAACKRAKQKATNLKKEKITYVNGTIPRDQMGEMTPEEELAYLRSRVLVLENIIDCKKNAPFFTRWRLLLRRNKNRRIFSIGVLSMA